jgi:hypothetical protein
MKSEPPTKVIEVLSEEEVNPEASWMASGEERSPPPSLYIYEVESPASQERRRTQRSMKI